MGRKKIDMEFIPNLVSRRATFKARIGGLVKKLHELTILCGSKATIVATCPDNNIFTYGNSNDLHLLIRDDFNTGLEDFQVKVYQECDVSIDKF
jgi:MADS-box transcription factor